MEIKNGKHGKFWGCPKYRSAGCEETRDVSAPPAESPRIAWRDGTSDRPGWTTFFATAGASLRSVPYEPLCPNHGISLVLKTGETEADVGRQFLVCPRRETHRCDITAVVEDPY
jgi:hypothetical protein